MRTLYIILTLIGVLFVFSAAALAATMPQVNTQPPCVNCEVKYNDTLLNNSTASTANATKNSTTLAKLGNNSTAAKKVTNDTKLKNSTNSATAAAPVKVKILFFYQDTCPGCQAMEPVISQFSNVTRINTVTDPATTKSYGVTVTPTIVIEGKTTVTLTDVVSADKISAAIAQVS